MPATPTLNEKPAEATTPGGLEFFSTTLSLTPGKDRTHVSYHDDGARVNAR